MMIRATELLAFWARRILTCLVLANAATSASAENGVTKTEILLGQTAALTGPVSENGIDATAGANAYFDGVNAKGGIHGRKIRIVTMDDAYSVDRGVQNARDLLHKEKVFALFSVIGTPVSAAVLPLAIDAQTPMIAPFTGSEALRQPHNRLVFNLRASYGDETNKIAEHLVQRGITRVAVVYQNNAFGKDGVASMRAALEKHTLKLHGIASIENDASDAEVAGKKIVVQAPQAVVLITAGKASVDFIKAYNKLAQGTQYFALSVMGTQTAVRALGTDGVGVVVSQVVPSPFTVTIGVVREYQQAARKAGLKNLSFASMEGFLNAKVTVEALRRAGPSLTRDRFIAGMESLTMTDFDGFLVNFSASNHQGSKYVELTVISRDGRFLS